MTGLSDRRVLTMPEALLSPSEAMPNLEIGRGNVHVEEEGEIRGEGSHVIERNGGDVSDEKELRVRDVYEAGAKSAKFRDEYFMRNMNEVGNIEFKSTVRGGGEGVVGDVAIGR